MSTNPNPETRDREFEELQRVLARKRQEKAPPPAFFQEFSHRVRERVQKPVPPEAQTWLQRRGIDIEPRALWYCGIGLLVCGGLVIGLMASKRIETPQLPLNAASDLPVGTPPAAKAEAVAGSTAPAVETGRISPFKAAPAQTQPTGLSQGAEKRE